MILWDFLFSKDPRTLRNGKRNERKSNVGGYSHVIGRAVLKSTALPLPCEYPPGLGKNGKTKDVNGIEEEMPKQVFRGEKWIQSNLMGKEKGKGSC